MSQFNLLETVYSSPDKIDAAAGIIHGVKILGRESANGRTYSDQAMADAARLYEGAEVNIDHDRKEPHRERGLLDGFGVLRGVVQKADGVFGDLHYLKSHPATNVFLERADRFPEKIGLSHNADGRANRKGGRLIVESISRINSVDVVRNPATNKGLFESKEQTMSQTIREILESAFPKTYKGCGLLEEDAAMAAMPAEAPAGASSDDQIKAAFRAAVVAAFDDDKLDSKATLKKIKDVLNAYDKLTGSESKPSDGGPAPEPKEEPKMESKELKTLLESVNGLKADLARRDKRDKARELMAELNVAEDSAFLESLIKLPDDKSMRELCEREAKLRPRANGKHKPFIESAASRDQPAIAKYPEDVKGFAAALR